MQARSASSFVSKLVGVLLPVAAIKLDDFNLLRDLVQTVHIDIDSVWIRAGHIERFNSAGLAEVVLCDLGIERISGKTLFAADNVELLTWNNKV